MTIWPGDEESIEECMWSAGAAGGTIFLIRFPAYWTFLVFAFWYRIETGRTGN